MLKSLALIFVILVCTSMYAQTGLTTVAVLEFQSTGGLSPNEVATLSNRFRGILVKTQAYDVVEREKMNEILKTQDFNLSDACNTAECAVQVGQLLGVEAMIAGDIGRLGETFTIDLRLIDVQTGKIQTTETRDYQGKIDGLLSVMQDIAGAFAQLRKPASYGSLELSSNPSGARISIDGKTLEQTTPTLIRQLAVGKHRVELRHGLKIARRDVEVKVGQTEKVNLVLAVPAVGVRFQSDPVGGKVYIDGKASGETPVQASLEIGTHQIKIVRRGYEDYSETLTLAEGDATRTVQAVMKQLPQTARKPISKMWYVIGGAAVLGGGAVVLLGGGGGGNGAGGIGTPGFPTIP